MKRITSLSAFAIVAIAVLLFTSAFESVQHPATGAVGDVKYSILPPSAFDAANGPGWILMDKDATLKLEKSQLKQNFGIQSLPDACGVFVRGVNLKREGGTGDPDNTRMPGSYQSDAFQGHFHKLTGDLSTKDKPNGAPVILGASDRIGPNPPKEPEFSNHHYVRSPETDGTNGTPRTAVETRPKNIALYVYVKIN